MKMIQLAGLMIALLLGTAVSAQDSSASVALTLERTACFGACPIYTVTVYDDGTVVYQGERFVDVTGEQTLQIDPATVDRMVQAFVDAGYFGWDEAYDTQTVTDQPTIITSVTHDGETHRIVRYAGDSSAPMELPFLETWIDLMTYASSWTGASPDLGSMTYGMESPVITLERTPCFGGCPVYDAVIYEDGTVVYMGLANVERLGVHVLHVEDFAVDSVIGRAEASGYFELDDAYDTITVTDQSNVNTSIRTDTQTKHITHYLGDASAPMGLVWVENSIELLLDGATP